MYRKPSSWCFIENRKKAEVNVAIDNTVIERVQSFNFLGIMLNEALSWKNHIAMVSNKITKIIGIFMDLKSLRSENHTPRFHLFNRSIRTYIL